MNQGSGFRRSWRSNRVLYFVILMMLAVGLVIGSSLGILGPLEGIVSIPLNFLSGGFNRVSQSISGFVTDVSEIQTLRERNANLEAALANFQSELVELRELSSDYQRLTELLDYTNTAENQVFVTADVIGLDQIGGLRTITINRGARDGLSVGLPVVTKQGLVGRIMEVTANASRVQLIIDQGSAVSARLQNSRTDGSIIGLASGNLRMTYIHLNATVQEGELVITSGLGGTFPADIVVGQVTSVRSRQFELFQEAEVRSLVNFDTLEFVLVITSFQPVDLSAFEDLTGGTPQP